MKWGMVDKISTVDSKIIARILSKGQCHYQAQLIMLDLNEEKEDLPGEVKIFVGPI